MKKKLDWISFGILSLIIISLFVMFNFKFIVKSLGFKICVEKGIKSNVWCFVDKWDDCSKYGWWRGVCGSFKECKKLENLTGIMCVGPLEEEVLK